MNNVLEIGIGLVLILVAMVLHELAHGVVAYWLGDMTAKEEGRLTLNPLRHLDLTMSVIVPMLLYIMGAPVLGGAKPVPVNTRNLRWGVWGMALVALAGPLMNFILAFIGFLIYRFGGDGEVALEFVGINLSLMVFNLIPIPPLDGSRVLYALAPDKIREFLVKFERYGVIVIYVLIFFGGSLFLNRFITGTMAGIWQFFVFITGA